jgi:hypothetical protein
MPEAKDSPRLDPRIFSARFSAAAVSAGFTEEKFGTIGEDGLFAYMKPAPRRPNVYLSAGVHGDEPAPPWSLLRLIEHGCFDDRCAWYICPLINPAGFRRATRENGTGLDINRDYKSMQSPEVRAHVGWLQRQPQFDVVFCLHEDWESQGFYLYELNPENRPTLAHAMLAAARAHVPIETAAMIDGRESVEPGIIRPISDPLMRETWPEAIYLREHHGTLHYTIESPSALPLEQRVATLAAAVTAALKEFLR